MARTPRRCVPTWAVGGKTVTCAIKSRRQVGTSLRDVRIEREVTKIGTDAPEVRPYLGVGGKSVTCAIKSMRQIGTSLRDVRIEREVIKIGPDAPEVRPYLGSRT